MSLRKTQDSDEFVFLTLNFRYTNILAEFDFFFFSLFYISQAKGFHTRNYTPPVRTLILNSLTMHVLVVYIHMYKDLFTFSSAKEGGCSKHQKLHKKGLYVD